MAARHQKGYDEKTSSCILLFAKNGLSNDDVGVSRATVLQEIRPGAGFKTGDFVEEKLRGLPQDNYLLETNVGPTPSELERKKLADKTDALFLFLFIFSLFLFLFFSSSSVAC